MSLAEKWCEAVNKADGTSTPYSDISPYGWYVILEHRFHCLVHYGIGGVLTRKGPMTLEQIAARPGMLPEEYVERALEIAKECGFVESFLDGDRPPFAVKWRASSVKSVVDKGSQC